MATIATIGSNLGRPRFEGIGKLVMAEEKENRFGAVPTILVDHKIPPEILEGVIGKVKELGWRVVDLRRNSYQTFDQPGLLGVLCNVTRKNDEDFEDKAGSNVPLISFEHNWGLDEENTYFVRNDFLAAGRMAADHFYELGIRNFGFLGLLPWGNSEDIYNGLRESAERLKCACHLYRYEGRIGNTVRPDGPADFLEWLANIPKPVGFVMATDRFANFLCTTCIDLGYRVPEDIAILGHGNNPFYCEAAPVSLSSIIPSSELRGRLAVEMLFDVAVVKREVPPVRYAPPLGIEVRQSTVPESLTTRALRFMREFLQVNLSVTDIADEFGVSRRKIERSFRQDLDSTVATELNRLRLERCAELLKTTDLQVKDIVKHTGFGSQAYLHRVFRKEFGVTPLEYRDQN